MREGGVEPPRRFAVASTVGRQDEKASKTVLPIFGDDHSGHSGPCDRYRVPVLVWVPVGAIGTLPWVPVGAQAVGVTLPGLLSGDHRVVVHDWEEHCDRTLRVNLKREGRSFLACSGTSSPESACQSQSQGKKIMAPPRAGRAGNAAGGRVGMDE